MWNVYIYIYNWYKDSHEIPMSFPPQAEMDSKKRGVLDAPEALQLLQVLATPGLTCRGAQMAPKFP